MQITIITNIIIRLLRYQLDYHIPNYLDNITYYLVTTCGIWSLLYFMQLIPYCYCFETYVKRHIYLHNVHCCLYFTI